FRGQSRHRLLHCICPLLTRSGHAVAAQQFPKGQLTAGTPGRPLVAAWEWPVAPIIPFESSTGRRFHAFRRGSKQFLSLTNRLYKGRAPGSRACQRYLAQAEEYCFKAETFRDPKTQAQMLRLAAICEHWAMQADE